MTDEDVRKNKKHGHNKELLGLILMGGRLGFHGRITL